MNTDTYKEDLSELVKLDDNIKQQYDYLIQQDKEFIIMNLFEERIQRDIQKEKIRNKNKIIQGLRKELKEYNDFFKKLKKSQKGINLRRARLSI